MFKYLKNVIQLFTTFTSEKTLVVLLKDMKFKHMQIVSGMQKSLQK